MAGYLERYRVPVTTRKAMIEHVPELHLLASLIRTGGGREHRKGWAAPWFTFDGVGEATSIDMAAVALLEGAVAFEDCLFTKGNRCRPRLRKRLNDCLRQHGWSGPFLDERNKNQVKSEAKKPEKVAKLKRRIALLRNELASVRAELKALEG